MSEEVADPESRVTGYFLQLIIVEHPSVDRGHGCKFPDVDGYVVLLRFTGLTAAVGHTAFQQREQLFDLVGVLSMQVCCSPGSACIS